MYGWLLKLQDKLSVMIIWYSIILIKMNHRELMFKLFWNIIKNWILLYCCHIPFQFHLRNPSTSFEFFVAVKNCAFSLKWKKQRISFLLYSSAFIFSLLLFLLDIPRVGGEEEFNIGSTDFFVNPELILYTSESIKFPTRGFSWTYIFRIPYSIFMPYPPEISGRLCMN